MMIFEKVLWMVSRKNYRLLSILMGIIKVVVLWLLNRFWIDAFGLTDNVFNFYYTVYKGRVGNGEILPIERR